MEQTTKTIDKEWVIGDVLERFPHISARLAERLTASGLHCVGCGAASHETIEQGVLGHGLSQDVLLSLVDDLNVIVDEGEEVLSGEGPILAFTDVAIAKVKEILASESKPDGTALKIGVVAGGCAGFTYDMSFQNKPEGDDVVIEFSGVNVIIDGESSEHLRGVRVDYVSSLQGSGFSFDNPNAKKGCGCGKSFS